jgi:hypothetical protein
MRNLLIITFVLLTTFTVGYGQTSGVEYTPDTIEMFRNNPELDIYGMRNGYRSAQLLQEQLELTERLNVYRKKRNRRQWIGAGLMGAGLAGLWYVAEMDEPLYQIGNQAVNDAADEQKRNRRIIAWPSALIAGAGAILFVDSFKFNKWTKLELGVAEVKITYELFPSRGRPYFNGKKPSPFKKKSLWRKSYPRYHR